MDMFDPRNFQVCSRFIDLIYSGRTTVQTGAVFSISMEASDFVLCLTSVLRKFLSLTLPSDRLEMDGWGSIPGRDFSVHLVWTGCRAYPSSYIMAVEDKVAKTLS